MEWGEFQINSLLAEHALKGEGPLTTLKRILSERAKLLICSVDRQAAQWRLEDAYNAARRRVEDAYSGIAKKALEDRDAMASKNAQLEARVKELKKQLRGSKRKR